MFSSLRPRALATLALPALVVAIGCAAKPTPVGKWSADIPQVGKATIDFKKDSTMSQDIVTALGAIQATGTYKVEGEKLDITVTEVKAGGNKIPLTMLPPQAKAQLNKQATWKIEGETMTLTDSTGSQALTRVKE